MSDECDSHMPTFLDERQAARLLGCSVRKLQRHRADGDGAPYLKLGRLVRYEVTTLLDWARSKRRNSTSEPDPNG